MSHKRAQYWPMLCAALAGIVYIGTISFHFVYDDLGQIIDNPSIRSWRFVPQYFTSHIWAGVLDVSGYYRPFDLLWFRLNYFLFGLNAIGWHATSIIAHAVATLMVFRLVLRLLGDDRIAIFSALIFGLHPIHVQSVAWVSGVFDPLLTIFMLGSVLAYLNFADRKGIVWLGWAGLLYACAALTKEPGILVPVLIVGQECLMPTRAHARPALSVRLKQTIPAMLLFLGILAIYLWARWHALKAFAIAGSALSLRQMVLAWPAVLWLYTKHLLFPWGYSLYYDFPPVRNFLSKEFLVPAGCLLLVLAAATVIARRLRMERAVLGLAALWFIVPMLPSLVLTALKPQIYGQDRYLYISCIGFGIFVSFVLVRLSEMQAVLEHAPSVWRYAFVLVPIILACCTLVQQQYWVSNLAVFGRAITIAPNNGDAVANMGVALSDANQFRLAVALFERDLERDPDSARLNYNYGYALYRMGDYKDALQRLARAVQLNPSMGEAFLYLGMAHLNLGYLRDADYEIRRALFLEPDRRGAHLALGAVLQAEGDLAGAIAETRVEASCFPDDTITRQRLLGLQQQENRPHGEDATFAR